MASILRPLPDRYFIFNFFEPASNVESFKQKWTVAAEYIKEDPNFVATYLHSTSDTAAKYPWVNVAVFSSDDVCCFAKPDPKWFELTRSSMMQSAKGYPAGYREVASFKDDQLVANNKQSSETAGFFITAIQVKESMLDEEFEKNWRELSGANLLHKKLENCSVLDTFLYRKFTTNLCPLFRFTLRTEVHNLTEVAALKIVSELNERKMNEGIETTTSFYKVAIKY